MSIAPSAAAMLDLSWSRCGTHATLLDSHHAQHATFPLWCTRCALLWLNLGRKITFRFRKNSGFSSLSTSVSASCRHRGTWLNVDFWWARMICWITMECFPGLWLWIAQPAIQCAACSLNATHSFLTGKLGQHATRCGPPSRKKRPFHIIDRDPGECSSLPEYTASAMVTERLCVPPQWLLPWKRY